MLPIDVPPPHNGGVELGPEARRNANPSEPETTLGPQARRRRRTGDNKLAPSLPAGRARAGE